MFVHRRTRVSKAQLTGTAYPFDDAFASSFAFPTATATSPPLLCCPAAPPTTPSLLLSLNTLVLIARCGDREPLPRPPPPPPPTDSVARRDLVVALERCDLEEAPLADIFIWDTSQRGSAVRPETSCRNLGEEGGQSGQRVGTRQESGGMV